ncbi:DUF5011 domain-containing protein [Acholeplasma equirhinis]|uniref:immunoglobulin-like domain-containing protein n=1 Tax=Acholeplasma equirhinis TaxID=555393 RepID=UPI00197AEC75|nr:immunoglobulin-like domain-containing protein [Acholeplasma equirhinis]MBN3490810.1 DUF5011 domain-containing protein [Acholeplasma equirhinis]
MFQMLVAMITISISWQNTLVIVPLYSSIENYKEIPYATLYMDGKEAFDPNMYYEFGVGTTNLRIISTNVVGEYHVDYRVFFPLYGFSSEETITFKVVDEIKPIITGDDEIVLEVGSKAPDFKSLIEYKDNYDKKEDLAVTVDSSLLNMNALGDYRITYKVKDKSQNITYFFQNIKVVDRTSPVVVQKGDVEIEVNEDINITKYFGFSDNYDKIFKTELIDDLVDYSKVGYYTATLKVYDQSDNVATINFTVKIKDQTAPIIKLKTKELNLNYQTDINEINFKDYIQTVYDNYDDISIDDVMISYDIDSNFLGSYQVKYEVWDSNLQKGEITLNVNIKDLEVPKVSLKEAIIVDVNTLEPYLLDYLIIEDNFDSLEKITSSITGKVSMDKIGEYRLVATIKDTSKNETVFPVIVKVVDREAPSLNVPNTLEVTNFKRPDYTKLITTKDNYDKDIVLTIYDDEINYEVVGHYILKIDAKDQSDNITTRYINLEIIDNIAPEIILKNQNIYVSYLDNKIDFSLYIDKIYDGYDKSLSYSDVKIIHTINFERLGLYEVIYQLEDSSHNIGEATLYVHIVDYDQPVLDVKPITIKQNQSFDYRNYVSAYDLYDGDLTDKVRVSPSFIPTSIPGIYEVVFYVHDQSGNLSEVKSTVTVLYKNPWVDYVYYGLGLGIVVLGGYLFYYFYNKRSKF